MNDEKFLSACACLGAVYGEPFCPCDMRRKGLPSSQEHIAANEKANETLRTLVNSGIFAKPPKATP